MFVGGGGGGTSPRKVLHKDKKVPHIEKKWQRGPHMVKKAPHKEKNVAKRPLHEEKIVKKRTYSKTKKFQGGWACAYFCLLPYSCPPPCERPMIQSLFDIVKSDKIVFNCTPPIFQKYMMMHTTVL